MRWVSKNLFAYIKPIRDTITIWLLLPMRDFYLWLPWPAVIGALAVDRLSLRRLAARAPAGLRCFGFLLLTGFWMPLMLTIYLVTGATILCVIIGMPLGVWASRNDRVRRRHHDASATRCRPSRASSI